MDGKLIARAVGQLHTADLSYTGLTPGQCQALFLESRHSRHLADLRLVSVVLTQVHHFVLAAAVKNLKKADLSWTRMTTDQVTSVLQDALTSDTLQELSLVGVNLLTEREQVSADGQSEKGKTVFLYFRFSSFSDFSIFILPFSIFFPLCPSNLTWCCSQVPTEVLARAVSHLRRVNLSTAKASSVQLEGLLEYSLCSTSLEDINLESGALATIPPHLLAR